MAATTKSEAVRVPEQSVESSASAVEWAAIVEAHSPLLEFQLFCSPSDLVLVFPPCHRGHGRIPRRRRLEWSQEFG